MSLVANTDQKMIGPEAPYTFTQDDLDRARTLFVQLDEVSAWRCAKQRRESLLDRAVIAVFDRAMLDDDAVYLTETLPRQLGVYKIDDKRTMLRQLIHRAA